MFKDELHWLFKENASFSIGFSYYFKMTPPWNDSLHKLWSMSWVVGEPFQIPRFRGDQRPLEPQHRNDT